MIIPDPLKKTVKIPIRIVDGRAEYFYGGPFPKLRDVTGDLVVPAFSLLDKPFAEECSESDGSEILPEGTSLMVNVWADDGAPGLCKNIICGPLSGNVEVRLLEPLFLWHRGTKSSVLNPCGCFIPALNERASSLNHAYTIISKKFETKRQTNTGNVFKKVYCLAQGSWEPLQRLREKFDSQFEKRFTSNRRQGTDPLSLDDSSVIDQSVFCADGDGRLVASISPDGLTFDEYEYSENNEHDTKLTVKTGFTHRVLFELLKERFTTAVEFDNWLAKKDIPVDSRSGFPFEPADEPDELFTQLELLFDALRVENYRSDQTIDSDALLTYRGDDTRTAIVDAALSERLDDFLAAGWIHVGDYFKRKPFQTSDPVPVRNVPIRIRLKDFSLSKHQKRVLKKNTDIRVEIRQLAITSEEEELFGQHKRRFAVIPPKSIYDVIPLSQMTDIKKLSVYEDKRLIAASYLDMGSASTYSMYAMFDPAFAWRSLGILTIIKEIQFSILQGMEFYYLGFVYEDPSYYDYKKHFHGLECFDWNGNWVKAERNGG